MPHNHPIADPVPETEIDRLARAARGLDPQLLPDALWRPVFDLPAWWIIATPTDTELNPCLAEIEGVMALLAFTSEERAQAFLATGALTPTHEGEVVHAVSTHPAFMVEQARIYHMVGGRIVLFNCNDVGFFCPLPKIPTLWHRYYEGSVLECMEEVPRPV